MFLVTALLVALSAYCVGSLQAGYFFAYAHGINDLPSYSPVYIGRALGKRYFQYALVLDCLRVMIFLKLLNYYLGDAYFTIAFITLIIATVFPFSFFKQQIKEC